MVRHPAAEATECREGTDVRPTDAGSTAPTARHAAGVGERARRKRRAGMRHVNMRSAQTEREARMSEAGERGSDDRRQKREPEHGKSPFVARVAGTKRSGLTRPARVTPTSDGRRENFSMELREIF